ncbi:MAG TPA: hypothetical protein DD381_07290 [Lentisphaeria bacterium]|nr:MAG: hypothetical protein A2X47_05640 [Lentisphaerae bacterium GWF2_38_69]HBM16126.1 hypothetical protein [Lentisphaeria bacterium]
MDKQFNNTEELINSLSESESFKKAAVNDLKNRKISQFLFTMRCRSGLNQSELAKKINVTQSKISKIESSADDKISVKDLSMYADALGLQLEVGFRNKKTKIFDLVKYHAFRIKEHLDELCKLAGDDATIQKGVMLAHGETLFNVTNMIASNLEKFPIFKECQKAEQESVHIKQPLYNTEGKIEEFAST